MTDQIYRGEPRPGRPRGPVPWARVAGLAAAAIVLGACLSYSPVAEPLLSACVGECGQTFAGSVVVPGPASPAGCPDPQCVLQIEIGDGELCPNESAEVTVSRGGQTLWHKAYTLFESPTPGFEPARDGDVELIGADVVRPGDVIDVSAAAVPNESTIVCKRQGNFRFAIRVLH